jgi:multidrug efflux pump subunit AcrA (membrane-fusion protein)
MLPIVSHFPMSMLFYGSDGAEQKPKYTKYFEESDLIAGDFLFMRKYMPANLKGKIIVTNTTTEDNIALLKERGAKTVITTTPRYDGRTFGTNMTEAMLTAYTGRGRNLTDVELNELIDELNKNYKSKDTVEIRAPQFGLVTSIEVHEGSTVKPMDKLFSFVNLSRVWVEIPLYPDQLFWVKNGDEATIRLPAGIREIKTKLKLIAPMVDNTTRTVLARLNVDNANSMLPLGSFLDVIIHAKPHKALVVPRSAVMRTGKGDLVMLAEGNGHFTPVNVETGIENSDTVEITSGLQAGDQVAVNGQFLLDAAASMSDTAQRLHNNHDANEH